MSIVVGLVLLTGPASVPAQVGCVRHDLAVSCADGTSLSIYDDPGRMGRGRGRDGMGIEGRTDRDPGAWWKDDRYLYGPDGEVCLQHGSHVHCSGSLTEQ